MDLWCYRYLDDKRRHRASIVECNGGRLSEEQLEELAKVDEVLRRIESDSVREYSPTWAGGAAISAVTTNSSKRRLSASSAIEESNDSSSSSDDEEPSHTPSAAADSDSTPPQFVTNRCANLLGQRIVRLKNKAISAVVERLVRINNRWNILLRFDNGTTEIVTVDAGQKLLSRSVDEQRLPRYVICIYIYIYICYELTADIITQQCM